MNGVLELTIECHFNKNKKLSLSGTILHYNSISHIKIFFLGEVEPLFIKPLPSDRLVIPYMLRV